ncbi:MAG TPA: hypothetical protein QGG93_00220 [Verrucomicrobiota bacterium]|nr:hypothetical protein [Verrucomicrobiota bacterium]
MPKTRERWTFCGNASLTGRLSANSADLIWDLSSFHCLTQQEPTGE